MARQVDDCLGEILRGFLLFQEEPVGLLLLLIMFTY